MATAHLGVLLARGLLCAGSFGSDFLLLDPFGGSSGFLRMGLFLQNRFLVAAPRIR